MDFIQAQRLSVSIQKQPHDECVDHFNMTVHYDVNEETQCWEVMVMYDAKILSWYQLIFSLLIID